MKPTCAIVVSAHAAFLITFTILCTIWKKLKRKPWTNLIISMIWTDILLQTLDLIYLLEFRSSAVLDLIRIVMTLVTRFGILIIGDHGKKVMKLLMVLVFSVDFIVALYDMAFENPDLALIQFWISSIRAVTNGSVILCLCSSCANPGFQEEKTLPQQKVCLLMQMHQKNVDVIHM